jgi:hypothetical protein
MPRDNAQADEYMLATLKSYGLTDEQANAVLALVNAQVGDAKAIAMESITFLNRVLDRYEDLQLTLASALALGDVATAKALEYADEYRQAVESFSATLREISGND